MLEGLDQKLSRVEYEELSSQVYDYEEEKNLHIGNRDMIDMERENLQVQAEQTEKKLHILQCARQQDSVSEEKGELDLLREKIAVARQQGADLEPERKALGLTLKNIFEERIQDNRQQQENLSENIQKKGKEAQDEANRESKNWKRRSATALEKKENWKAGLNPIPVWKTSIMPSIRKN